MVTGLRRRMWRNWSAWRGVSVGKVRDLARGRTHRPGRGPGEQAGRGAGLERLGL